MPPPAPKPASFYLMLLKVVFALALAATVVTGMFTAVASRWLFTQQHGIVWMLGLVGANALLMIVIGLVRAREQSKAAKKPASAAEPAHRRFAGAGRL